MPCGARQCGLLAPTTVTLSGLKTHDRSFFRLISSHLGVEALIQANALLKEVMASTAWVSVPRKSDSDTADEGDEGYISSSV
jgi:hypothetical protein